MIKQKVYLEVVKISEEKQMGLTINDVIREIQRPNTRNVDVKEILTCLHTSSYIYSLDNLADVFHVSEGKIRSIIKYYNKKRMSKTHP